MVKVIANRKLADRTGSDLCRVQFNYPDGKLDLYEFSDEVMSATNALLKQFYRDLVRLERHNKIEKGLSDELLNMVIENIQSCSEDYRESTRNDVAWEDVLSKIANGEINGEDDFEEDETTRAMNKLAAAQADMEKAMNCASSNVLSIRRIG